MKRHRGEADDDRSVHEEMLRHLRHHPPSPGDDGEREEEARAAKRPRAHRRDRADRPKDARPSRPSLMLRRLRADLALDRLTRFLVLHQRRGTPEVLVIVGKGKRSPDGRAVLGPAVRELCRRRRDLVLEIQEAPPAEGGDGALILRLTPPT